MKHNNAQLREHVRQIIAAAIAAADPNRAIERHVSLRDDILHVGRDEIHLGEYRAVHVIGAGKASGRMAGAVADMLGERIAGGIICTKGDTDDRLPRIKRHESSHPVPDEKSREGARRTMELVESCGAGDLIICLISGGASAMWCLPAEGISLSDKKATTDALLRSGANIHEMNAVRKHISAIKGGRLAGAAHPARLITLLISDVVGDEPSVIGSGPTVPDPSTYRDALEVIETYDLHDAIPDSVYRHLQDGAEGKIAETPKPGDTIFDIGSAHLIASNQQSISAAQETARELGYTTVILTSSLTGEAKKAGHMLADRAHEIVSGGRDIERPAILLAGGETTVTIKGDGTGGRNQELALAAAIELAGYDGVVVASVGTDGIDGPTDAAGAIIDGGTVDRGSEHDMDARAYLDNNDSYAYFNRIGELVRTGPTGTNVMDIQIVAVGADARPSSE